MPAWNGWFHLMTNTYGTWLPGDGRGFRTRHHREHVEGDYKKPPPRGKYDERFKHARGLLKREPVFLSPEARRLAVEAFRYTMGEVHKLEVLAIAVTRVHVHVLVRMPGDQEKKPTASRRGLRERDPARYYMGIAKERSSKSLVKEGLVAAGGAWAKRGKVKPIRDRKHQVNVFRYILDHLEEGGAVWCFKASDVVRMEGGVR